MTLTECDFIKRDDEKMDYPYRECACGNQIHTGGVNQCQSCLESIQTYTFPDPLYVFGKVSKKEIRVGPKQPFRWPFVSRREYYSRGMKWLVIFLIFYIGFQAGRWDATYGYETGHRHGTAVREFIQKTF